MCGRIYIIYKCIVCMQCRPCYNSKMFQNVTHQYLLKICGKPIDKHYLIYLTIKLLPPLSKGNIPLIHICLFNNHHKFHPPGFEFHTPRIIFFIHPLDVHVFPTTKEGVLWYCSLVSLSTFSPSSNFLQRMPAATDFFFRDDF